MPLGEAEVLRDIDLFLSLSRTATLATADEQGQPFAANVQFARGTGYELTFLSETKTQHAQNLVARPSAAVTIYGHDDRPEQIHGLQMRGQVHLLEGEGREAALRQYLERYAFAAQPPFRSVVDKQGVYRFEPSWIRWIDNRRGFGWKTQWTI